VRQRPEDERASEITPEELYLRRRDFLKRAAYFGVTSAAWGAGLVYYSGRGAGDAKLPAPAASPSAARAAAGLRIAERGRYSTDETETPYADITTYNNYYEFGTEKSDPSRLAGAFRTRPWSIRVEGEVKSPRTIDFDTILGWFGLEERIYRMRCVEAWSMVVPWLGFPLADFISRLDVGSRAKYVEFTTLLDPDRFPGQKDDVLPWPYVEGLRIDEATNPLAFLAIGLYGKSLLGQNGAPIRLVVPWKYGFKGIKAIVKMRFTETRPETTWNKVAPNEYGFYANVNPLVDHPRWSQASERRIGELSRRPTRPFNGYAKYVAGLYSGMDLNRNF